jgi:hypothetical protein
MPTFIDCSSLSMSYDSLGRVTLNYVVVSSDASMHTYDVVNAGGQTFTGYVVTAALSQIPNTNWYETHVTLISTTN